LKKTNSDNGLTAHRGQTHNTVAYTNVYTCARLGTSITAAPGTYKIYTWG
jgi:hypothetical protein